MASVPRQLRACLVCAFVQPGSKFSKGGCPNCEDFLEMRGNGDAVADCTSEVFEGTVVVNDTNSGWVAKWLRIQGYVPGIYAVKVNGLLAEEYQAAAENHGIRYVPRDGSANNEE